MRRDLSLPLLDLAGNQMQGATGALTLGSVAQDALLGTYADEGALPGTEKFARYQLAQKLHGQDAVDLSAEEIALIKKLIGKAWSALVVGRAFDALEAD